MLAECGGAVQLAGGGTVIDIAVGCPWLSFLGIHTVVLRPLLPFAVRMTAPPPARSSGPSPRPPPRCRRGNDRCLATRQQPRAGSICRPGCCRPTSARAPGTHCRPARGDTAILHYHRLSFRKDLHSDLAATAAIFNQNDSVAPGLLQACVASLLGKALADGPCPPLPAKWPHRSPQ
jgi:hypothetical protein